MYSYWFHEVLDQLFDLCSAFGVGLVDFYVHVAQKKKVKWVDVRRNEVGLVASELP